MSAEGGPVVDLGGCEGCGLGCAVACADGSAEPGIEARRLLIATGLGLTLLAAVVVVGTGGWLVAVGLALAALGLAVSLLAGLALRAGRPGGDRPARVAYRLVPVGVAGVLAAWIAMAAVHLFG